ncbi:MAG: hypothetical protein DHS20C21_11350 [Gemmatimonadota bacterium]|nr:MAG: hypothetical protein DHS20C21_11350 [Gemmatimonadota bacterium]
MKKAARANLRLRSVRHSLTPARSWTFIGPISVFLVVALLSTLVFGALRGKERHEKRRDFVVQAQQLAFSIENRFELPRELLRSVVALFLSSDDVSREEFGTFVRPIIARHPSIYAFEWMPLVTDADRDRMVQEVRAEGFADFDFQQRAPKAGLMRAARRADYLPILYMEPIEPVVLGLDVIGNPERGDESARARATGEATASDRYNLIEDPEGIYSVISYEPVFRVPAGVPSANTEPGAAPSEGEPEFLGLLAVLLRLEPVVQRAIAGGGADGIHILLRDESGAEDKQILFSSPGDVSRLNPEDAWTHKFHFADRQWSLRFTPLPDSTWVLGHGPIALWAAGLLLGVLAAFASGALLRIGQLRRSMDEAMEFGQYRLGKQLGQGGMGAVYEAEHRMLARPAAIKLIRPTDRSGPDSPSPARLLARFEREAKATAALHSAHTIQVYDFGVTDDGEFYYVMELLDGLDLDTLVKQNGPVPAARVVHILRQVCDSLAEAHAVGLVHRDIKPANIYLCHHGLEFDFVKVLDFGLVRQVQQDNDVTRTQAEAFLGTPAFCAPEMVATDAEVDGRSDLYSLGCVAYWLLTGRPVFEGKTPMAVILAHVDEAPVPPSQLAELEIPAALEDVVMDCLQKDPAKRPAGAAELAARLEGLGHASADGNGSTNGAGDWTQARARHWWEVHRPIPK